MAYYDESGLDFLNDSSRYIQNDIRKKATRTPHGVGVQDSGIRTLPQGSKAAQLQEQMFRKNRRNNFGWRNEQLQEQMGRQFNPLKSNYGWNVQHNPKFMELRQALENQSSGASWMKPERKTIGEEEEEQLQEQIARQRNNFGWRNKQLQEQIDRGGGETPLSLNAPLPYGEVPGIPEDTPKINENNRLGLMNTGNLPAEMMLAELTPKQQEWMRSRAATPDFISPDYSYKHVQGMENKPWDFQWGAQEPTTRGEFDEYYNYLLANPSLTSWQT